jgi:hypothetical protein
MSKVESRCLICGSSNNTIKKAVISGFLLERIWDNKKERTTELILCNDCGFAFFSLRPTDEEMSRLYSGYRSDQYQEQRQKFESWYTKEINNWNENTEVYESRQEHMKNMITENSINASEIKSALDWGGYTGLNLPRIFVNAEKYVFDISGVRPEPGVTGIVTMEELNERKYDFIMIAGVLEHLSDPYQMLENASKASGDGGLIYLEVPIDSPFYKKKPSNLQFLSDKRFSKRAILKHFWYTLRNPYTMREHINYFTPRSFETMVKNMGWELIDIRVENMKGHLGNEIFVSVLAKIK